MKKSLILFLVFISCGSIEYEETLNESSETAESTTTTVSPSTTTTTVSPSTTTTTVSPSTTTTTVSPCSQNTNGPDYTNATLSSSVVDVSVSSMNLTVTVDVFDECAVPNNPVMTIVDNNNTIVTGKESQLISGTLTDGTFGYIFDINSSSYPSGSYSVVINGNNDLNRQANEIILVFEVINNPPTTTTTTTIPIAQYPQLTSFNISGPSESTYGEDITYSFSFTIDPAGQTLDSNYLRFTFARVGTNSGNIGCINSSLTANSSSLFSGSGTCIVNWSDSTNVNTNFRLYKVVIKLSNSNLFTQYENTGYVYENISSSNMKSYQHNFFDSEVITTITP